MTGPILVKLRDAAAMVSQSEDTIRRAIRSTGGLDESGKPAFPPPLKAKKGGRGEYLIRVTDLDAWADRLSDA